MTAKARITSDFPSEREIASHLRIPASRAAQLNQQLADIHIYRDGSLSVDEMKRGRNGSRSRASQRSMTKARAKKK